MHKQILLLPLFLFLSAASAATTTTAPAPGTLPRLAKYLAAGGAFGIDNEKSAAQFALDRRDLGENFHPAALRFAGDNAERHYWLGVYLTTPDYLKGDKTDPYFALLLFEQGLVICENHKDDNHAFQAIGLRVMAAIQAQELGFADLACHHKSVVETALKQNENLGGGFPALDDDSRKIYDAIKVEEKPAEK